LCYLPKDETEDPNLLVGYETSDDAGVYKINDDTAIVQTLDYFTPIVDNPYDFGRIAAANALSDIYAMGAKPLTVLNIVGFPIKKLDPKILAEILRGAADKVKESGARTIGGHTIDDNEPKFGLSATGVVHPSKIWKNYGALEGEVLVITKPLGIGILTTAIKRGLLSSQQTSEITDIMATLNKDSAEALSKYNPTAVTDVTGFGLLGHAYEMASNSNVSFEINFSDIPVLNNTMEHAINGVIPGGSRANLSWLESKIDFDTSLSDEHKIILADAITSGGLLASLPVAYAEKYVKELNEKGNKYAKVIGKVVKHSDKDIIVKL
jgi:selenide,water dikinase